MHSGLGKAIRAYAIPYSCACCWWRNREEIRSDVHRRPIYHNRARFDFDVPNFTREVAQEAINKSQRVIDEKRAVIAKIIPKEEALAIPNLARTEPGIELLKKLEIIRVVEIVGFDIQLDGGTHVANTSEIGNVELSNFENKGSRRKRMEIILK